MSRRTDGADEQMGQMNRWEEDAWMDEWMEARRAQVFMTVFSQGLFEDYLGN